MKHRYCDFCGKEIIKVWYKLTANPEYKHAADMCDDCFNKMKINKEKK